MCVLANPHASHHWVYTQALTFRISKTFGIGGHYILTYSLLLPSHCILGDKYITIGDDQNPMTY